MRKEDVVKQGHLADLDDEKLLDLLGWLWEEVKNIDERMKADPEIERLTDVLKVYKDENYLERQKAYKAQLKAARMMAKARGLAFTAPEIK